MGDRVVVFIDYQNVYRRARGKFFQPPENHTEGNINPVAFAKLICKNAPAGERAAERDFEQVRVYVGRPSPDRDPKSYWPHMRQCAAWEKAGSLVFPRPLRYPLSWPTRDAEEKGIDVSLAVDFVGMAVDNLFDIGVIASVDTDLMPAIGYVHKRQERKIEVTAWHDGTDQGFRLKGVWCHRLARTDYESVADYTDYNKGLRR